MIKNLSRNLKKISCNHSKKPERKKSKQYRSLSIKEKKLRFVLSVWKNQRSQNTIPITPNDT
ncbi:hypothetical protein LEP1GSC108_0521 [Leptospira weilii str. UI 13098]|uniref:Uncharacterized protein n=1 Tax=Leptospira weilii str. UI 13098 TaxID=1088542 RepID=M6Q8H1_9LEPT|nr:hypothetical protein LEP1GSC108_0521 [Leptospira weilii str. UI 13098]